MRDFQRFDHQTGIIQAGGIGGFIGHAYGKDIFRAEGFHREVGRKRRVDAAGKSEHSAFHAGFGDLVFDKACQHFAGNVGVDVQAVQQIRRGGGCHSVILSFKTQWCDVC